MGNELFIKFIFGGSQGKFRPNFYLANILWATDCGTVSKLLPSVGLINSDGALVLCSCFDAIFLISSIK